MKLTNESRIVSFVLLLTSLTKPSFIHHDTVSIKPILTITVWKTMLGADRTQLDCTGRVMRFGTLRSDYGLSAVVWV